MNEYEIDCEVCESTVIVYNETDEAPGYCPVCGSPLLEAEIHDVV